MARHRILPIGEFIALLASIMATIAFSIDAVLPAFPAIAAELTGGDQNRAQLILSFFVAGVGLGTFVTGAISDAYGRLPVLFVGFTLYALGAALAWSASSFEAVLAARFLQGLGGSAPRTVAIAIVRDLYSGPRMARITSFIMTVFMLVPACAPLLGSVFIATWGWRSLFGAYVAFAAVVILWLALRQAETLAKENRRPFTLASYLSGTREILARRDIRLILLVLSFAFAQMFALLSAIQQIYEITYQRGASFPLWFMLTAVFSAATTVLNASIVMRVGMARIARGAYLFQVVFSTLCLGLLYFKIAPQAHEFAIFFAWSVSIFFMAGLTFGNLNAMALQPLGHMAGLGASLISALSTLLAVLIAYPISHSFAGTPIPLMIGAIICSSACLILLLVLKRAPESA